MTNEMTIETVELELYDGKVKLFFNEGDHKYLVSHKVGKDWTTPRPTTGVSTYCGALSKDFLAPWAAKLAAEYVAENLAKGNKTKVIDAAKAQHRLAASSGARAGKLGHSYVEGKLTGRDIILPTDPDDLKVVESVARAFAAFITDWNPEFKAIEAVLYSQKHDFAGTCDFVATVGGKLIIGDWKTTNTSRYNPDGIYSTYFAQLGAYCLAYEEMTGEKVEELWVVNLPKDGSDYKLKRLEDIRSSKTEAQAYFLELKGAYEANKHFEWALSRGV